MAVFDKDKSRKKIAESCINDLKKLKVLLSKDLENEEQNKIFIQKIDECIKDALAQIVQRYLTKD